jgi:hypothetical protein
MHDKCIKNSKSKCNEIFDISHTNPPTTPIQFTLGNLFPMLDDGLSKCDWCFPLRILHPKLPT